ncbi:hypothetical protein ACWC5I_18655, partial [Kitasatospora sp. NPDC001574]
MTDSHLPPQESAANGTGPQETGPHGTGPQGTGAEADQDSGLLSPVRAGTPVERAVGVQHGLEPGPV